MKLDNSFSRYRYKEIAIHDSIHATTISTWDLMLVTNIIMELEWSYAYKNWYSMIWSVKLNYEICFTLSQLITNPIGKKNFCNIKCEISHIWSNRISIRKCLKLKKDVQNSSEQEVDENITFQRITSAYIHTNIHVYLYILRWRRG